MASVVNSTKCKELTPTLYTLFRNIDNKETLSNSLYESSIILLPKPDKEITRKLQTPLINIDTRILSKILRNWTQ